MFKACIRNTETNVRDLIFFPGVVVQINMSLRSCVSDLWFNAVNSYHTDPHCFGLFQLLCVPQAVAGRLIFNCLRSCCPFTQEYWHLLLGRVPAGPNWTSWQANFCVWCAASVKTCPQYVANMFFGNLNTKPQPCLFSAALSNNIFHVPHFHMGHVITC